MAPLPATSGPSQRLTCAITPAAPPAAPGKTTNSVKDGNLNIDIKAVEAALAEARIASKDYNDIFNQRQNIICKSLVGGRVLCDLSDPDLQKVYIKEVKPAHIALDNSVRKLRRDFKNELMDRLKLDQRNVNVVAKAIEIARD